MVNIRELFEESICVKKKVLESGNLAVLEMMGEEIKIAIQQGKKLMLCGNGGSAADAQHLAAEMLVRLRPSVNRRGIPAIALAQDTSTITACGNDFGIDCLYERMVQSLGQEGDVLIGISTSGNSSNIVAALKAAKQMNVKAYGFLGSGGGAAINYCDKAFIVPSENTARIQEVHITAGHALMEFIEDGLIENGFLQLIEGK